MEQKQQEKIHSSSGKTAVVVVIAVTVALLHLVDLSSYRGPYHTLVTGYLMDVLIPFSFYMLLSQRDYPVVRLWIVRAALVFGAASGVEVAQYFGKHILGSTYDPMDFVAYGIGVALAVICDRIVFPRVFGFWTK